MCFLVDDEFGDEYRDHEGGCDAHLVGYELDHSFARVLLVVDVPLHQRVPSAISNAMAYSPYVVAIAIRGVNSQIRASVISQLVITKLSRCS